MRVGKILDSAELIIADRFRMGEIESEAIRRDKRTFLRDVIAEHLAQCFVQEMRRRMVGANRAAALVIDFEFERLAERQFALFDHAGMNEDVAEFFLCVGDAKANARR